MGEQGSGNALLGLIPGFGQGFAEGRKNKVAKEHLDSQTVLIKAQAKAAEAKLLADAKEDEWWGTQPPEVQGKRYLKEKDSLTDDLTAIKKFIGEQAAPQPTQVPLPEYAPGQGMPPFRPGATMTLPQQIAQGQGGGDFFGLTQDDLIRGVIKKKLGAEAPKFSRMASNIEGPQGVPGIVPGRPYTVPMDDRGEYDWSKAQRQVVKPEIQRGVGDRMASTETPVDPYTREPIGAPIQTGPPPTLQLDVPTAGGGKEKKIIPLFPGAGGPAGSRVTGTTMGGVRTELDLLDVPIPALDITKWSDGKGGNPPVGWTPRQAQGRGFNLIPEGMSSESGGKVVMLGQAVTDMEKAISMILPPDGGFNRKLAIGAGTNAPEFAIEGSQIVRSAVLNAMSAKLRMETGAQSNESEIQGIIDRYWPSGVRDSEKSARYKMTRLLRFMEEGRFIMNPKGKGWIMIEPPDKPVKPSLGMGKGKKDPSKMTDAELLGALGGR